MPVLRSFAVLCDFQEGKPSIKRGLIMVITLLCKVFGKVISIAENCFEKILVRKKPLLESDIDGNS